MHIAAIIVTYNRAEKLIKSIDALLNGLVVPRTVVVVNNNSNDETELALTTLQQQYPETLHVVTTNENIGGAGGFSIGLKKAYDLDASHYWIMDDDSYAQRTSLSALFNGFNQLNQHHEVGFVCSKVDWIDGSICEMNQPETAWDWMRHYTKTHPYIKVNACSFVSCFFSRTMLERHGLPLWKFFIWFDDSEFTRRLSRHHPCFAILDSVVVHDTPINQGVYFAKINQENLWKYRFGAKNESWYRFKKESPLHWLLFVAVKNAEMLKGRVKMTHILAINAAFLKGVLTRHRIHPVQTFPIDQYLTKG